MRELPVPVRYTDVHDIFDESVQLNEDTSPEKYTYHQQQFNDFARTVMDIPGAYAAFGTGYPFYAEDHLEQTIEPVAEITRFLRQQQALVPKKLGSWACIGCQGDRKLPDLKTLCKPCDKVSVKPRDILKALPDLDYWVIADEDTPQFRAKLQQSLEGIGFYSSDQDVGASLRDLADVMKDPLLVREVTPEPVRQKRIPIDLHVVSREYFMNIMGDIERTIIEYAAEGGNMPKVPISPSSLHVTWEQPDEPYDFMKDFLFSLTIHPASSNAILEKMKHTKEIAGKYLSYDDIKEAICQYDKEERQLQNPKLRFLLSRRFSSE